MSKITEEEILVEKQTKGGGQDQKMTEEEFERTKYLHETQRYYSDQY